MIAQMSEELVWNQIVARAWCDNDFRNQIVARAWCDPWNQK
jgi:hypothetical protein